MLLTNSVRPMLKGESPVVESELYDSGVIVCLMTGPL